MPENQLTEPCQLKYSSKNDLESLSGAAVPRAAALGTTALNLDLMTFCFQTCLTINVIATENNFSIIQTSANKWARGKTIKICILNLIAS